MAQNGKLELELLDVYGQFLNERVDVLLRSRDVSHFLKKTHKASAKFIIPSLHTAPQGAYYIDVSPLSYMPVNDFINIKGSGVTPYQRTYPVNPKKVLKVNFPKYDKLPVDAQTLLSKSENVLGFVRKSGPELYDALEKEDVKRAGLLNILAKTNKTRFSNGRTVLSYLQDLRELRGDRFFVVTSKELREETKHSVVEGLFTKESGALHHLPSQFVGYTDAGSFKTAGDTEKYGNLQLTFYMKGDDCVADIDIDDAKGLEHFFQVVNNMLPGNDTHPYTIHEILIAYQKLDPGYTFIL